VVYKIRGRKVFTTNLNFQYSATKAQKFID